MVEFFGAVGMGAQRWIDLGFIRLQPSEMMKFTLVMVLAAYYGRLDPRLVSRPLSRSTWVKHSSTSRHPFCRARIAA